MVGLMPVAKLRPPLTLTVTVLLGRAVAMPNWSTPAPTVLPPVKLLVPKRLTLPLTSRP